MVRRTSLRRQFDAAVPLSMLVSLQLDVLSFFFGVELSNASLLAWTRKSFR